jgi:hypothetical protein
LQEADALQDAVGGGRLGPADDVVGEHVGVRVGGLRRRRRKGVEVFCGVGPDGVGEAGVRIYGCAAGGPEVCLGGVGGWWGGWGWIGGMNGLEKAEAGYCAVLGRC